LNNLRRVPASNTRGQKGDTARTKNGNLQKITNQYLDWFKHTNAPLPKENLFAGIKSD
jgi:hypothetical protein